MRRLGIVGTALLLGLTGSAWAADSIQMLPPKDIAAPNDVCPSGGDKLLSWDGSSALKCNKNLTTDSSGNLQAGGDLLAKGGIAAGVSRDQQGNASYKSILYSDGNISTVDTATVSIGTSALNATGIDTVNNLKDTPTCSGNQVLKKTGDTTFSCVDPAPVVTRAVSTVAQCHSGPGKPCSDAVATCPVGYVATGGGSEWTADYDPANLDACPERFRFVIYSKPEGTTGWRVRMACSKFKAHVVCAKQ
jgi:hypothetical protein